MKCQKAICSLFQNFLPLGRRERLELETRLDDEYYREVKIGLPYLTEKGQAYLQSCRSLTTLQTDMLLV